MSQPKNLDNTPQPARTDRSQVPTRAGARIENININNRLGADRSARNADTAPVTIASPRASEAGAAMSTPDHLPAQQSPVTGTPREPGASASDASVPSGRLGQYELIRQIGRGGIGAVYLARDLRLGRLVAIKLLARPGSHDNARFLAEARVTARCNHENIVVIYDVGEHDHQPYMVLEYVAGQTLRAWLDDRARRSGDGTPTLEPSLAASLMLPVVRALAYAHEMGIVHRDLKPANIMLTDAGTIKVLDFGIATLLAGSHASSAALHLPPIAAPGAIMGTLPYMSPEQLEGDAVDHRTDLWAVGIMLYQMVTGTHPVIHDSVDLQRALLDITELDLPMPGVGERRPDLGPLAGIIDRCLIKNRTDRTRDARVLLQELETISAGGRVAVVGQDGNPFAGLAPFQEADADRFYGRAHVVGAVLARLRGSPLVALAGPSGAGKSSLVRAGVIPALKRSGEGWDAFAFRPGREPLAALASILARANSSPDNDASDAAPSAERAVLEQLRAEPGTLGARLRAYATNKRRRIAIFVDQLEELYTLGVAPAERAAFLACIAAVADDATSPLRVLVSMRSDFLDRLTEDRWLGAEITRGLVLLPPMDREGMREALLRPVEASEHRFEPPALVDRMVDALAATPGALPLLQFTAARLWEQRDRDRRLLTEASYEQLGGVAGALATHADAVLAGMSAAQQALARTVLECLVTPERTRAVVSLAELHALHRDPNLVDGIVQHLIAMRLVVIERGAAGADHTMELVHESLIDRWPTLVRWLDENQDDTAMLARVRGAARDWERSGHAAGLLWTGEVAQEARAWRQRYQGELAPAEQRYLAAVLAASDRARRIRRRLFLGILGTAVLAATAMAWLAWRQTEARQRMAEEAMRTRDATRMAAMRALPGDPTSQLALLREIENVRAPPPGADQEAKRLLYAGVAPIVWTSPDAVYSAAFSPDGRRIVFASADKTVQVWNADGSGEPLVLRGHDDVVDSVAFSPDGRRIVSASWDKTVRMWSADGSGEPLVLRGHDDPVISAAFSPDGRRIVSASWDKTVRVWNADGRGEPLVLRGHDGAVISAAFSPDGRRIVSASRDKTVRVWNADGRGEPLVLRGHDGAVTSAAFSPDGRRIVSASFDKTVRVWNADGRGEPLVLRGHDDTVSSVAFSPDGRRIVSASWDKTVRVWNADGRGEPLVLRGHDDEVLSAAFSPDGRRIVSASFDKTVRVWSADGCDEPLVLRGHDDAVISAAFSPDGRRIVSASRDKTVRVWSADGRGELLVLRGHDDTVVSAAFSPDGRRIVSSSRDKTIRVWNADGRGEPLVLRGHDDEVSSAVFSPDGRRIVSASDDKTVRVWNADGRGEPLVLRGHDDAVASAAFSPDGRRIVSASKDKTVRVWNANGRGEPLVLRGHDDTVMSAAFSPDGRRIVSASWDKTVRVWNADGTGELATLIGHNLWVMDAQFSPDGRRVVSASLDHTVRVWHDLAPVSLDDARLWAATSYCMPIKRRIDLLGVSQEQAERDRQNCLDRVERARVGEQP